MNIEKGTKRKNSYNNTSDVRKAFNSNVADTTKKLSRDNILREIDEIMKKLKNYSVSTSQDDDDEDKITTTYINQKINSIASIYSKKNDKNSYQKSKNTTNKDIVEKMNDLLTLMEQCYQNSPELYFHKRPDIVTYTMILSQWCKAAKDPTRADALLCHMEKLSKNNSKLWGHIQPNTVSYSALIHGWCKSNSKGSAYRAEERLFQMEQVFLSQLHHSNEQTSASATNTGKVNKLNTRCYNAVIDAWGRRSNVTPQGLAFAKRADSIFRRLLTLEKDNILEIDNISFSSCVNAWARTGTQQGLKRAKEITSDMESMYSQSKNNRKLQPNVYVYTSLIQAYSNLGYAKEAENVLKQMVDLYNSGSNLHVKPNSYTYTSVIKAWANSNQGLTAARRAEDILAHMEKLYQMGNRDVRPLTMTFNAVLQAWAEYSGKEDKNSNILAAERAESILIHMEEISQQSKSIRPNAQTFNNVLLAWSRCHKVSTIAAAERAERILFHFLKLVQNHPDYRNIIPDVFSFNVVISLWSRSKSQDAARRAEAILYRMMAFNHAKIKPNTKSFSATICAWARIGEPQRAEELLNRMEKLFTESGDKNVKPNFITMTSVIDAYAKRGQHDAGLKAEKILNRMQHLFEMGDIDTKPNTISYNAAINAWSQSNNKQAGERAEKLLNKMIELCKESGDLDVQPNSRTVNSVIQAWSNVGTPEAAERAEYLLEMMETLYDEGASEMKADQFSFASVINAWSKSDAANAGERALKILDRLEKIILTGEDKQIQAHISYNLVIKSLFTSTNEDKSILLDRAVGVLNRMEDLFLSGFDSLRPDERTYAAILYQYSCNPTIDYFYKAESVFLRMQEIYKQKQSAAGPKTAHYNLLLTTLSKSLSKEAFNSTAMINRLESIMEEMEQEDQKEKDQVKPDSVTYALIIGAYCRCARAKDLNVANKVEVLLERLEKLEENNDDESKGTLNTIFYNTVLNVYAKTRSYEAAEKAHILLKKMENGDCFGNLPDAISYTTVMNAWGSCCTKETSLKAEKLLDEMELASQAGNNTASKPDAIVYNTLLKAWACTKDCDDAHLRASSVLSRMIENYKRGGNSDAKPDLFSLSTTLKAWNERGEAFSEEYFETVISLRETIEELNSVKNNELKKELALLNQIILEISNESEK